MMGVVRDPLETILARTMIGCCNLTAQCLIVSLCHLQDMTVRVFIFACKATLFNPVLAMTEEVGTTQTTKQHVYKNYIQTLFLDVSNNFRLSMI